MDHRKRTYKAKVIGSTADQISVRIYNQARAGTPNNPGVPIDLANLIVAQAKHETGDFTSNVFKKQNNAFGYSYYPSSNYQKDQGTDIVSDNGKPVAEYASIEDSVKEIVDWIYRRSRAGVFPADLSTIKTPSQYANYLKSAGYYGDTIQNYLNGLVRWFQVITPGVAGGAGILLLILAAVLYFARK